MHTLLILFFLCLAVAPLGRLSAQNKDIDSLEDIVIEHNRLTELLTEKIKNEKPSLEPQLYEFLAYWKSLQKTKDFFSRHGNGNFKLALSGSFDRQHDLFSQSTRSVLELRNLAHVLPDLSELPPITQSATQPLAWDFKLAETKLTLDWVSGSGSLKAREFDVPKQKGQAQRRSRGMVLYFSPTQIVIRSHRSHSNEPIDVNVRRRPKTRR